MGKRGPQPGWKNRQAPEAANAAPARPAKRKGPAASPPAAPPEPPQAQALTYEQRNNPKYLSGQALRDFAHSRGIPRSSMETMTDEKVRTEVSYLISRSFDPEG